MKSRRRKKKDSPVKVIFLALFAIVVMVCAVSVILSVYHKISRDYENLENMRPTETMQETVAIDSGDTVGWISEDGGYKYRNEDGSWAKDEWKVIDGLLYRFDENEMLKQGEWKEDGQIFTCGDKGYLKDIQPDPDYVPEETGEDLDNLVKANAYWCYLGEAEGPFKPILYRRATETSVKVLGSSNLPEETTMNSMRAYGDYVYYLPKVESADLSSLTERQRELCDTLFRVIPGSSHKEMIAENVGGYLVLDDTIYYSQNYRIYSADSGTSVPIGEEQFSVSVENGSCYLLDGNGQPVEGDENGSFQIGSRLYHLEDQGKIISVTQNEISVGDEVYLLDEISGGRKGIYRQSDGQKEEILVSNYGIQSFCIVNQKIYYCAYVQMEGEWYSQIFSADLDGGNVQSLGGTFLGTMETLYFYESAGEIYGEYYPEIWNRGYGQLAAINLNGSIYLIADEEQRTGKTASDNERLNLVMADGTDLICLWRDVVWSRSLGVTSTLWNQAIKLNKTERTLLETGNPAMTSGQQESEEGLSGEQVVPIVPETSGGEDTVVSPVAPTETTVAPPSSETVSGEAPTVPVEAPTASPGGNTAETQGPQDEVVIVPIG